jgi:alkylation response protein AidB-like acyl-CoA dehydrogenase
MDETALSDRDQVTEQLLARIASMADRIRERRVEFDDARRIPADLIAELREAGVFKALLPRRYGGLEVGAINGARLLEALSRIDGSLGWTMMIGMESPQILALLQPATYEALHATALQPLQGGTFLATGEARRVPGGYRVSGRWGFASGCQNWTHVFGNCVVLDEQGQRLPGKLEGTPLTRSVTIPVSEVTIEDTWKTLGMRGTGSHHFNARDVFVPEEMSFDILYDRPTIPGVRAMPLLEWYIHIAVVLLGTAQGALDEFIAGAQHKQRVGASVPAAKSELVQHLIGQAEVKLRAARAYLYSEAAMIETLRGDEPAPPLYNRMSAHNAFIAQTAREVTELLWKLTGASAAYEGSSIQRYLRDVLTGGQHAAVSEASWTQLGARLLGETVKVVPQTQMAPGRPAAAAAAAA